MTCQAVKAGSAVKTARWAESNVSSKFIDSRFFLFSTGHLIPSIIHYPLVAHCIANMSDDDLQEPLLERLSASPAPKIAAPSKKRKRTANDAVAPKEKKAKNKKKKDDDNDAELDFELGLNMAFSHMDNQLLSDYVAQKTRKFESDLSSIELEDRYLKGRRVSSPSS